jgi:hypothetical protein
VTPPYFQQTSAFTCTAARMIIAMTLRRHGLAPEFHVSRGGPYFLDTDERRRTMRLAPAELVRAAAAPQSPIWLAPLDESGLMEELDRMTRFRRDSLHAPILIRKGPLQ